MDIFNTLPLEPILKAAGLNYAQLIAVYLFSNTPIVTVVFISAFFLCLFQLVRFGNYLPIIKLFFIVLTIFLLLVLSTQEDPIPNQDLKDQITSFHQVPIFLNYIDKVSDAVVRGVIYAVDLATPDWARYLDNPYNIHRQCLSIREETSSTIKNPVLQQQLSAFLHDHFLPALAMSKSSSNDLWPGHDQITLYYSPLVSQQWRQVEQGIKQYFHEDFTKLGQFTQVQPQVIEQSFIKSIVNSQLRGKAGLEPPSLLWQASAWTIAAFPIISGTANLLLYAFFPFLILFLCLTQSFQTLWQYLKVFTWVKSLDLTAALSFYASLLVSRLQVQPNDPSWAWERPYFCVSAAVFLVLIPIITIFLINKGGRVWGI